MGGLPPDAQHRRASPAAPRRAADIIERLPALAFSKALFSGDPYPESCPVCLEDFGPPAGDEHRDEPAQGPLARARLSSRLACTCSTGLASLDGWGNVLLIEVVLLVGGTLAMTAPLQLWRVQRHPFWHQMQQRPVTRSSLSRTAL